MKKSAEKLIMYDEMHAVPMLETFMTFVENWGRPVATARELKVSKNTITYRIDRIKKITSVNVEEADQAILLYNTLKEMKA